MAEKHRLLLIVIKYIPFVIGMFYFLSTILSCFGVITVIIPVISQLSIFSGLFILLASYVFDFCIWHRLPIYYCWTVDILSFIDITYGIPMQNHAMLMIYLLITIVFILLGMYLKNHVNKQMKSN